jgi:hypothetical protein
MNLSKNRLAVLQPKPVVSQLGFCVGCTPIVIVPIVMAYANYSPLVVGSAWLWQARVATASVVSDDYEWSSMPFCCSYIYLRIVCRIIKGSRPLRILQVHTAPAREELKLPWWSGLLPGVALPPAPPMASAWQARPKESVAEPVMDEASITAYAPAIRVLDRTVLNWLWGRRVCLRRRFCRGLDWLLKSGRQFCL